MRHDITEVEFNHLAPEEKALYPFACFYQYRGNPQTFGWYFRTFEAMQDHVRDLTPVIHEVFYQVNR